jgi:hypothetical protein
MLRHEQLVQSRRVGVSVVFADQPAGARNVMIALVLADAGQLMAYLDAEIAQARFPAGSFFGGLSDAGLIPGQLLVLGPASENPSRSKMIFAP